MRISLYFCSTSKTLSLASSLTYHENVTITFNTYYPREKHHHFHQGLNHNRKLKMEIITLSSSSWISWSFSMERITWPSMASESSKLSCSSPSLAAAFAFLALSDAISTLVRRRGECRSPGEPLKPLLKFKSLPPPHLGGSQLVIMLCTKEI